MSETAVRVELRQATLSENARLRDAGELLFLAIENPPPVRSLLRLSIGDEVKAFEVARVVEVVDEGEAARGCYGREIALDRLADQDRVGSEHLQAGMSGGGGGVPAPVVIMNTNEMMLDEAGEDGERAAAEASGEPSALEDEASRDEASGDEASGDEASGDAASGDEAEPA